VGGEKRKELVAKKKQVATFESRVSRIMPSIAFVTVVRIWFIFLSFVLPRSSFFEHRSGFFSLEPRCRNFTSYFPALFWLYTQSQHLWTGSAGKCNKWYPRNRHLNDGHRNATWRGGNCGQDVMWHEEKVLKKALHISFPFPRLPTFFFSTGLISYTNFKPVWFLWLNSTRLKIIESV